MFMTGALFNDYGRDRAGWFLGMSGGQLGLLAAGGVPELVALGSRNWAFAAGWLPPWAIAVALLVLPVRGRSAARWVLDLSLYTGGALLGWTAWQSRAAGGVTEDGAALIYRACWRASGSTAARPVVEQDLAARTWAAVARIDHPGIGLVEPPERDRMAGGLPELLEVSARTELVEVVALQVRTVPDDGAEHEAWEAEHRQLTTPPVAVQVTDVLARTLTPIEPGSLETGRCLSARNGPRHAISSELRGTLQFTDTAPRSSP
jgi:hypothetical protein